MLRKRALQDQVGQLLDNLGPEVNDVAATLIEAGAQGVPRDANSCVIAAYLHAVLGAERAVHRVKVCSIGVDFVLGTWWRRRAWVAHPPPVRRFIRAFDHGMFPPLTRGATPEASTESRSEGGC